MAVPSPRRRTRPASPPAAAQVVTDGSTVVTPIVVPAWGVHPLRLRLRVPWLPRHDLLPDPRVRPVPSHRLRWSPSPRLGSGRSRLGSRWSWRSRPERPGWLGWTRTLPRHLQRVARRGPRGLRHDRPRPARTRRRRPVPASHQPGLTAGSLPFPAPSDSVRGRIPSDDQAAPTTMPAMKTILVVDDEPAIVQLARDYLEHAGYTVLTAADGTAALAAYRRHGPDLIVLDLGLPGTDGLDVTREIRRDSTTPIVMLTARDDELDKLLGLELGADDYLTKPFSPRELVARVRAVLRRAEPRRRRRPTRSVPPTSSSTSRGCGPRSPAGRWTSPRPSSSSSRRWPRARVASSPDPSSWTRCAASPSSRTSAPSIPTSRTCAASSSPIRASRATSSPCTASATASPTIGTTPG